MCQNSEHKLNLRNNVLIIPNLIKLINFNIFYFFFADPQGFRFFYQCKYNFKIIFIIVRNSWHIVQVIPVISVLNKSLLSYVHIYCMFIVRITSSLIRKFFNHRFCLLY